MKRSDKVVLTALFLTAVSAAAARAQEVNKTVPDDVYRNDTMDTTQLPRERYAPTTVVYTERRRGFFHIFGRYRHHRHTTSMPAAQVRTAPRTRGFGTTMYRSASAAHS